MYYSFTVEQACSLRAKFITFYSNSNCTSKKTSINTWYFKAASNKGCYYLSCSFFQMEELCWIQSRKQLNSRLKDLQSYRQAKRRDWKKSPLSPLNLSPLLDESVSLKLENAFSWHGEDHEVHLNRKKLQSLSDAIFSLQMKCHQTNMKCCFFCISFKKNLNLKTVSECDSVCFKRVVFASMHAMNQCQYCG